LSAPPAAGSEAGTAWKQQRQRGGRLGNLFFMLLATSGRVGLFVVPFFTFWVALYFVLTAPVARRASAELARRLGRGRWFGSRLWFCFRQFYVFGRLTVDRHAILAGNEHLYRVEFVDPEHLTHELDANQGVILLNAHVGNWEVMGHLLKRHEVPVTLVMFDGIQPQLRETMERMAQGRSFHVLFTDGSPAAAAGILSALGEGHLVGMMGDRVMAGESVRVPFLGGKVDLPVGPFVLAAISGAPLVTVFGIRRGNRRYTFQAMPAQRLAFTDRRNKRPDLERWATAYAQELEAVVRRDPYQWGNLFPIWVEED